MVPLFARVFAIALLALVSAPSAATAPTAPTGEATRWIVELDSPPLALRPIEIVGRGGLQRPIPFQRLDVEAPESVAYLRRLDAEQSAFATRLQALFPIAEVQRRYQVTLNAVAISAPPNAAARLAQLPGVRSVSPDSEVVLHTDPTFDPTAVPAIGQIGAADVWAQLGPPSQVGAGVKIAIIDAGVFTPHPTFNPAGFAFPPSFPKGETTATNAKVIAARAYFRPNHPPQPGHESPVPPPNGNGHGTHVASIAAGNPVIATASGLETPFSGVAPGAYLMNYRIFYPSQAPLERFRQESAFTVETLAAIEDAVRDGADVINNSWGSRSLAYNWPNPTVRALENAVLAGVVVVNSAGNAGPGTSTVGSGASSPLVIAVGMVTTNSELARDFVLTPGAPEGVARLRMTPAAFGPRLTGPTSARPIAIVQPFALPAPAACAPLAPNSLEGNVAIIARGGCTFVEKAINAQNAGAEGVIFVNNEDERLTAASTDLGGQVRIPAVTISRSDGRRLIDWFEANGGARVQLDPSSALIPIRPDVLSQGSSRGPALEPVLKPDLVAPGVEILAAGFGPAPNGVRGFGPATGTSMAAPHVSGAAAIMRQLRPDWSPTQIKAALMSTADTNVRVGPGWLAGPMDRGAGRIDLARALDPAIVASPPSLSFGETTAGRTLTQQARVTALQRGYYRVSVNLTGFNVPGARPTVQVSPREFALDPNTFIDLTVQVTLPATLPPSDHQGDIQLVIDGRGVVATIPFAARVMPDRARPVLLIDNDGSSDLNLPNTLPAYTQALDALGVAYDVLNVDALPARADTGGRLPPLWVLQQYQAIILFTGSREAPTGPGAPAKLNGRDQDLLGEYLTGGGRLLAAGRNFAAATDLSPTPDPIFGRSRLFTGFMGAQSRRTIPAPATVVGADNSPLTGVTIRMAADARLPVLQPFSVDGEIPSVWFGPETVSRLAIADSGETLGLFNASEPTPTEPRRQFAFRTAVLGFGLEDVAPSDRPTLLQAMLAWFASRDGIRVASGAAINTGDASFALPVVTPEVVER